MASSSPAPYVNSALNNPTSQNLSMTTLFKNNLNLSSRQNISALKIQTVKILSALVSHKPAAEHLTKNCSNVLQFLFESSSLAKIDHKGANFYSNSLNNPIFGPAILLLCEIFDQTKFKPIKTRLEVCLKEITEYGKVDHLKMQENLKNIQQAKLKLLTSRNVVSEAHSKKSSSTASLASTCKFGDATKGVEELQETLTSTASTDLTDSDLQDEITPATSSLEKWSTLSGLVKKDGLLLTTNYTSFFKTDEFLYVDRAKRITKNNLVERIRLVTDSKEQ